jgi:CheY-like chemotaxis protein
MYTILIIDDDYFMRKLIEVMLIREGHSVQVAEDTEQASKILAKNKIDLITCDIMLPDMDGLAFLRKLKSDEITQSIPVIMITATGIKETLQAALENGACCVIEKPFTAQKMIAAVDFATNPLHPNH